MFDKEIEVNRDCLRSERQSGGSLNISFVSSREIANVGRTKDIRLQSGLLDELKGINRATKSTNSFQIHGYQDVVAETKWLVQFTLNKKDKLYG